MAGLQPAAYRAAIGILAGGIAVGLAVLLVLTVGIYVAGVIMAVYIGIVGWMLWNRGEPDRMPPR